MASKNQRMIALEGVLVAAEALLDARDNQMLTQVEWDAVRSAVAAVNEQRPAAPRSDTFSVVENVMFRRVAPAPGSRAKPYQHTCDQTTFEEVAHAIDELHGATFTFEEIRDLIDAPFTQVAVAVAFMKQRGLIDPAHRRRCVAATDDMHLDAMCEWHALREGSTGSR